MRNVSAVVLAAMFLGGCGTINAFDPYVAGDRINGGRFEIEPVWSDRFAAATDDSTRQRLGRDYAEYLFGRSDRKCRDFFTGLNAGNDGAGASLDLLAMGLSFFGGSAGSLGGARDLATGSGVIQALRNTGTSRFYDGMEHSVVHDLVFAARSRERARLMAQIRATDFVPSGPESINAIVNDYDAKCGVQYAGELWRAAVDEATRSARENPREPRPDPVSP